MAFVGQETSDNGIASIGDPASWVFCFEGLWMTYDMHLMVRLSFYRSLVYAEVYSFFFWSSWVFQLHMKNSGRRLSIMCCSSRIYSLF